MGASGIVKTADEINKIRKAAALSSKALRQLHSELRIGMREIEIADRLHEILRCNGVVPMTWGTIVASGENAANPHASPTEKRTCAGEIVIIDFGAQFEGYAADITRSFFFGSIDEDKRRMFDLVLASYESAMAALAQARSTSEIERAHRQVFIEAGMDKYALRSLGHGIGTEVHEAPFIKCGVDYEILPGMTFTIEPGLYIPGLGGARIEDDVLVTIDGFELLSDVPLICNVDERI